MKLPPIEFRYVNSLPKSLDELLKGILYPSDPPDNHQSFFEVVMAAKSANDEGRADSDEGIRCKVEFSKEPKEEAYFHAYIQYLGMALHYLEQSNSDAAWYYYAQSRYYRGLLDTRKSVLRQIEAELQSIEDKRLGGKSKAAKDTGAIKDELIKIIENPPGGGWENRKQLLNIAIPRLQEFHYSTGQMLPYFESIEPRVKIWLDQNQRIIKAFIENSANPDLAMNDLSEKSSDPNSNFGL